VRTNAAEALGQKGPPGHRALVRLLDGPDRYAAQKAASMLQDAGVLDHYVEQLVDGTARDRADARTLLGKLIGLQRTDLLTDLGQRHKDPRVREAVTGLLETVRPSPA